MTSVAVFFMREASSPTVISSGIFTVSGVFLMTSRLQAAHLLLLLVAAASMPKAGFLPPLALFLFLLADLLLAAGEILRALGDEARPRGRQSGRH